MSNRLPSANYLSKLGDHDRWAVLDAHARFVHEQIVGLKNGHMGAAGTTKSKALANLRRQLSRVYRTGHDFGCDVTQAEVA